MSFRFRCHPFCLLFLACALASGCGKAEKEEHPSTVSDSRKQESDSPTPVSSSKSLPDGYARLHQTFREATRENPPEDERPVDLTRSGKATGKLYGEVIRLWDRIRFMNDDGERIEYTATLDTELGEIEIALDPDRAPNHARSFIALCKVGYYDGLVFDRIHHQEMNLAEGFHYEEIEAGCPLGTGAAGKSSIGYWLKPEFSEPGAHEEGSVGACRGAEKDTAACKFYVTLCKAPYLDGEYSRFGKVTRGLEVARKIFLQPVLINEDDLNDSRRPLKPVVIRKATIQSKTTKAALSRRE